MTKHTPGPWTLLPQNGAGPMLVHEFETGNQMNPASEAKGAQQCEHSRLTK